MQLRIRAFHITSALAALAVGCSEGPTRIPWPPVPALLEAISPVSLTAPAASVVTPAPAVRLLDSQGNPMPGFPIHFRIDASTPDVVVRTNVNGLASIGSWTLGTELGIQTVTASVVGLPPVVFTAVATREETPADTLCRSSKWCSATPLLAFVRDNAIFAINTDDAGAVRLTGGSGAHDTRPVWSPDRSRLAFSRWVKDAPWPNERLCVLRFDGSGVRCASVIVRGRASWSPDGTELAFVGSTPADAQLKPIPLRLYAIGTDDMSRIRVITENVGQYCGGDVSWSPVGNRIAITSIGPYECGSIATVNPDGGELRTITRYHLGDNEGDLLGSIAWSPDGRKLVVGLVRFVDCWDACDTAIGVINADGTGFTILRTVSWQRGEEVSSPVWSPDGESIAYSYHRCAGGTCQNDVLFIGADGSARAEVVANAQAPTWR